jgi:hypothetical protein
LVAFRVPRNDELNFSTELFISGEDLTFNVIPFASTFQRSEEYFTR